MHKLTKEYIESRIATVNYHMVTENRFMICTIHLDNGFIVTGESACNNPKDFSQKIGEEVAYDNAVDKLWSLFSFVQHEREYDRTIWKDRLVF